MRLKWWITAQCNTVTVATTASDVTLTRCSAPFWVWVAASLQCLKFLSSTKKRKRTEGKPVLTWQEKTTWLNLFWAKANPRKLLYTVSVVCALPTQPCWCYRPPDVQHSADRAFPVASARAWNSLPSFVRHAPSLTTLRRELKTVGYFSSRHLTMTRRSWLYCTV